ncbi:replication protein RepA [Propionivibrio soli]|uniref:replication protein RepA n=1 Tax=Propionivibrio soli TaxID=2976531 RepID=UPI0021E8FE5D|nr:replication protein RepA [Propionivibrio soli]
MHSTMCQLALPRSEQADYVFERQCGNSSLRIAAGSLWDGKEWVQQPLPYGPMARMILAFVNTYAIRNQTPEVVGGGSKAECLRMMGKTSTGGKKGNNRMFEKQLLAMAACEMSFGFRRGERISTCNERPIKKFDRWVMRPGTQDLSAQKSKFVLSTDYFSSLREHAVPCNIHAVFALSYSALALDVYFMLAERLHRVPEKPVFLRWANLYGQFGQEYRGKHAARDFKRAYTKALHAALHVYPDAKVDICADGIRLHRSPPPIPRRRPLIA